MLNHPLTQMPTHMPTLLVCGNSWPTGQRFMRIDRIIDERMDPYISADAAMDLLEYNYQVLGTWPLALTAYNQGVGRMSRAVRETGTDEIQEIIKNYKGPAFVLSDGISMHNSSPSMILREIFINILMISSMKVPSPSPRYD